MRSWPIACGRTRRFASSRSSAKRSRILSDETRSHHPQIPWKQIAGMRDKVIHDYFGVNLEIVWAVIVNELPKLREAVVALL